MTAALSIARLDVLSDARLEVHCAAHAVAMVYGRLDHRAQEALDPMLRSYLEDLSLRLALYHSLRDGEAK